jgi:hypothetical protein
MGFVKELGLPGLSESNTSQIMKIIRKHSTNSRFINKGEFKHIYSEMVERLGLPTEKTEILLLRKNNSSLLVNYHEVNNEKTVSPKK